MMLQLKKHVKIIFIITTFLFISNCLGGKLNRKNVKIKEDTPLKNTLTQIDNKKLIKMGILKLKSSELYTNDSLIFYLNMKNYIRKLPEAKQM